MSEISVPEDRREALGLLARAPAARLVQLLPDLPVMLRREESVSRALAASGVEDYHRLSTRITARIADAVQAAKLQIEPGDALLRTEGLSRWQDRMVERALTWWAAERVTLTLPHPEV